MALATYTDLKTSIANWLVRSDLTTYIPDYITLAEERIFSELRVREMEKALSDTIASGVIAVPSDYVELKFAYLNTTPVTPLTRTTIQQLYQQHPTRSSYDTPSDIARNTTNFEFGPYPDSAYTVKGTYYAAPVNLDGTTNTTNVIFPTYASVYLWASLVESAPMLKDDARIAMWESKYQAALSRANRQDKKEGLSGSPLQPRSA